MELQQWYCQSLLVNFLKEEEGLVLLVDFAELFDACELVRRLPALSSASKAAAAAEEWRRRRPPERAKPTPSITRP